MTDQPQGSQPGPSEPAQDPGLQPRTQYVIVNAPPAQAQSSALPRFFWLWTLLAVVLAVMAGAGAYAIGRGSGEDLGAARATGRAQGLEQGRAAGLKAGRARGLKAGRRAGYSETYQPAYDKAYDKARG